MITIILSSIIGIAFYTLVYCRISNIVREKYGVTGCIWLARFVMFGYILIMVATGMKPNIITWILFASLLFNLVVYNPWSLPKFVKQYNSMKNDEV